MKNILPEECYSLTQNVTDSSREKEFLKKQNNQLLDKYNSLLGKYSQFSIYKTSLIKLAILSLTSKEIAKHYELLSNLTKLYVYKKTFS